MSQGDSAVVVVGSLHYDIMVHAAGTPRQGETITGQKWSPKFGGKGGNQAVAAARTGALTRFVGAVGTDDFGPYLLAGLTDADIGCDRITLSAHNRTGMSVAIIDASGDYGAVIVSGANADISLEHLADRSLWRGASILILQNEIPTAINIAAARQARTHGLSVCLNAAPTRDMPDGFWPLIDILVVNAIEAADISGIEVHSRADAGRAATALTKIVGTVIVTAGGDGMALARRGEATTTIAALPVDLIDTHGAGDVFVGTMCAGLAAGNDIATACHLATAASARHVSGKR